MVGPWLAWTVWDVLSAVLVLAFLSTPVVAVVVGVYVVVEWRSGDGGEGSRPPESASAG